MISQHLDTIKKNLTPLSLLRTHSVPTCSLSTYIRFYSLPDDLNITHDIGYIDTDNFRICAHTWQPDSSKGTVFIVHGYFDHSGLYRHIIRFFLDHSYNVFIFDLPGHGLSSGETASINHFSEYSEVLKQCLNWAKEKLPEPWHFFGQSTGAAIITNSLAIERIHFQFPVSSIILCAPLVRINQWKTIRCLYYFLSPFTKKITRKLSQNSNDTSFLTFLSKDPLQPTAITLKWINALYQWEKQIQNAHSNIDHPTFIIQGENDNTVDWRYNLPFLESLYSSSTTLRIHNAFHHLVNESPSIRAYYLNHLQTWLTH